MFLCAKLVFSICSASLYPSPTTTATVPSGLTVSGLSHDVFRVVCKLSITHLYPSGCRFQEIATKTRQIRAAVLERRWSSDMTLLGSSCMNTTCCRCLELKPKDRHMGNASLLKEKIKNKD